MGRADGRLAVRTLIAVFGVLAGLVLILLGVAMIYWPAAIILAGIGLLGIGLLAVDLG